MKQHGEIQERGAQTNMREQVGGGCYDDGGTGRWIHASWMDGKPEAGAA